MGTVTIPKRAKLWNRGAKDFKHMVMGREVFIPADGFIECSRREAISIRGHCTGKDEPVSLVVELIENGSTPEHEVYIDHRTGQQFPTKESLLIHLGIDPKEVAAAQNATVYKCPCCSFTSTDADVAKKHMAECLSKFAPKVAVEAKVNARKG